MKRIVHPDKYFTLESPFLRHIYGSTWFFFLGLWKEISPALAICSLIFLLDFCFYVYVSVISDPVDDAVSAIIVIFAIPYFFGVTNGLTNILYIQNLWCRNRADQNKVYITFSQMKKSSLKDDIV